MGADHISTDRERSPRRTRVTVQTMAGNVIWGPTKLQTSMTVKELVNQLDRPAWCPGVDLLKGQNMLSLDDDVSKFQGPVELQAVFKQPPPINHRCISEFLGLDTENADDSQIQALWKKFADRPAYEGISSTTAGVSEELITKLNSFIDKMKQSQRADYHPGTDNIVRDIVHPSMYPFISGISALANGLSAIDLCTPVLEDMWGRPYEESVYQWLPAEVTVAADGKCTFSSYINNLPQKNYGGLYGALEELLSQCLPHFENCLSYAKAIDFVTTGEDGELMEYDRFEQPELDVQDLKDRKLQVIVKIVDMEVPPGGVHEGVWHVEGMSHENIAATAELILHKDPALQGADLEFKRAFTIDEAGTIWNDVGQCRSEAVEDFISTCLVPLGRLDLPCRTLASWPNSHVHRITPLKNLGQTVALRRIVVFWLINPDRRIVSTASVPQQQGVIPPEIACAHRLKLMEERKRHKQDWNVREISLCEH